MAFHIWWLWVMLIANIVLAVHAGHLFSRIRRLEKVMNRILSKGLPR